MERELESRLGNLNSVVGTPEYKNKDAKNTYNLNNLTISYLGPDNPHRTWDIVDKIYGHVILDKKGAIRQATRSNDSQDITMTDLQEALTSAEIILQELSDGVDGRAKPPEKPVEVLETNHTIAVTLRCLEQKERLEDTLLLLQKIVNKPACSGDEPRYRIAPRKPCNNKNIYRIKGFIITYLGTDNPNTVWKIEKDRNCVILDSLGCVRQAVKIDAGSKDSQDMTMTDVQEAFTSAKNVFEGLSKAVKIHIDGL